MHSTTSRLLNAGPLFREQDNFLLVYPIRMQLCGCDWINRINRTWLCSAWFAGIVVGFYVLFIGVFVHPLVRYFYGILQCLMPIRRNIVRVYNYASSSWHLVLLRRLAFDCSDYENIYIYYGVSLYYNIKFWMIHLKIMWPDDGPSPWKNLGSSIWGIRSFPDNTNTESDLARFCTTFFYNSTSCGLREHVIVLFVLWFSRCT